MKNHTYLTYLILLIFCCFSLELVAQVRINDGITGGTNSALLDINSHDKGLLVPRLSTVRRDQIPSPATGLFIYNTTTSHFNYYNGNSWYQIESTPVSNITGTKRPGGGISISSIANKLPDSSAMLDASDTIRGFLPPRTTQGAIINPENGLIIYDISSNQLKYFFDTKWYPVCAVLTETSGPATGTQDSPGVAINTSGAGPHHSAIVDVTSSSKGMLIPRLTNLERDELLPATGLTIFNTSAKTIEYFDGTTWLAMNIILPVDVTISATAMQVCAGVEVIFTATPINGGANPQFQWKINNTAITGATNSSYTYAPQNNDQVTCSLTSSLVCSSGSPATSNVLTMTVFPLLQVAVSIQPAVNPVCEHTLVTFTATPFHGGTAPLYQWKLNGDDIAGATNATYSFIPVNDDAISCELTSNAVCPSGNPAASNVVYMTVNPLLPASISIAPSANPVCAQTSVKFTASVINGGISPLYQWKLQGNDIPGATSSEYIYVPVNGDIITCKLTSSEPCAINNPVVSGGVTMTVHPLLPVSIAIAPSANPVCAQTQVTFTSVVLNGGSAPVYQWRLYGAEIHGATDATYSYVPVNNDPVSCQVISNATCAIDNPAISNEVLMTVHPLLPVSISIAPSANPVCAQTQVTFTSAIVNGGTAPLYQWKLNDNDISGATEASYTYVPVEGDAITCKLTSNAICPTGNPAISNVITMTVYPLLPVSITITPSGNPVCAQTSVTYTSAITNGGAAPSYQWKLNGNDVPGATDAAFTYVPVNDDVITCKLTSNATCATGNPAISNPVTMTVHPLKPVSITIAPSDNPVCAQTSVTYTSTIVHGGVAPLYQWKLNGNDIPGATNASYTFVPVDGDAITCKLTSNAVCAVDNPALSNVVTMTVHPLLPVSISISPSANPVCAQTSVTYTSSIIHGGFAPLYQWNLNGNDIPGATESTYTYVPVDADAITCKLTSNATCPTGNPAISNAVIMTVHPLLPVSISISPSANPVCAQTSVTYTSAITNGGLAPLYQWKLNGTNIPGATDATYTYVPVNDDVISCRLTSNAICAIDNPAISNLLQMTVHPLLPVSITIAPSANPVCAQTTVTFTSTIVNGGLAPLYQWKLNGNDIPGATNNAYSYVPVNNDAITCKLTSNATCAIDNPAISNEVEMTVYPLLPVSITIAPSANPVCAQTTVTFVSNITHGGSAPLYQWKVNGSDVPGATNANYAYVPVNNDVVQCKLTSNATCAINTPALSNVIVMIVNPLLPVSISISPSVNPVCALTPVTFSSTNINGGSAPLYQWKLNGTDISGATNATYIGSLTSSGAITCRITSSETCATGSPAISNTINMTVIPLIPVSISITASANPISVGTPVTFTATYTNGGSSPLFQWKKNGTSISGATTTTYTYNPVNNDNVTCVLTSSLTGCLSGNPVVSNVIVMLVADAGGACPGTPTVTYSNKTYNTVQIGVQCWFRENLDVGLRIDNTVTQSDNQIIEKYCYANLQSNCDIYGGLYKWDELMKYVTTPRAQGICPDGWHVPDSTQFGILSTFLGGDAAAGQKMKEAGTVHWLTSIYPGNNSSGFTGLGNGHLFSGAYVNMYKFGYFYTSTQNSTTDAWYRNLAYTGYSLFKNLNTKTTPEAVRCLKN